MRCERRQTEPLSGTHMMDRKPGRLTSRYIEAFRWALETREGQTLRNTKTIYMSHPMIISATRWENGADEAVAIAALLHDMVEDQRVPVSEVSERFYPRVARIVTECTDVTADADRQCISWPARKISHARRMRAFDSDSLP
jgi:(p)ppGpp synthase/HD superfamily hydrolase